MNLTELLERVGQEVGEDISGGTSHWSDTEVTDWLNEGIKYFARSLPDNFLRDLQENSQINIVNGTSAYSEPSGYIRFNRVRIKYSTSGDYVTAEFVDWPRYQFLDDNDYLSPSKTYPYWSHWDEQIHINPTPDADVTNGLDISGILIPSDMSTGTDVPQLPDEFHDVLVLYACFRMYQEDENLERASYYKQQIDEELIKHGIKMEKK